MELSKNELTVKSKAVHYLASKNLLVPRHFSSKLEVGESEYFSTYLEGEKVVLLCNMKKLMIAVRAVKSASKIRMKVNEVKNVCNSISELVAETYINTLE